jgi:hypothetical protein
MTGSSYATTVTTSTATTEAADPGLTCGNGSRSKSVWYRFTAPSTGTLSANTFGSSYDTILSVYSGTCGAFRSVAPGCNDDAGGTMQSQLTMTTTAGATYYFMVTAYSGNGGTQRFQLSFQSASVAATPLPTSAAPAATATATSIPPPTPTNAAVAQSNDACQDAVTISAAPYAGTASTATATIATNDPFPTCGNGSRARSVWYRFTAPSTSRITADTFTSSYDTILSVYTGACGVLTAVSGACNDDAGVPQSQVSFAATAGTTYYFLVTAYNNSGGALVFHLTAS